MRLAILLLLLLPAWARAQATLTGTVRDSLTQQPLPFAGVFLVNTTLGATADARGHYVLPGVPPGRYVLAAAALGYRLRAQALVLPGGAPLLDFALQPTPSALGEVVVRASPRVAADYQRFRAAFLGASSFSRQCVVRNPAAVQVAYDPATYCLTARVPAHPLVVDNQALGYQLSFYDLDLRAVFDGEAVTVTTRSQVVFKELPGTARQRRRWAANRLRAYRGSWLHFLRSAYTGQLVRQGFRLQRLQRRPNRAWVQADSLVRTYQRTGQLQALQALPPATRQHLAAPHTLSVLHQAFLPPDSVRCVATDGRVRLCYRQLLAVTYDEEHPDPASRLPGAVSGRRRPRYQESVLRPLPPQGVELAANGVLAQPLQLLTEGYWGFEKIGELLPLDYQPPAAP